MQDKYTNKSLNRRWAWRIPTATIQYFNSWNAFKVLSTMLSEPIHSLRSFRSAQKEQIVFTILFSKRKYFS